MHWREELGPADQTQAAGGEVYKWVMPLDLTAHEERHIEMSLKLGP